MNDIWSNEKLQSIGIRWRKNWVPQEGMVGFVVGCLSPNHAASNENSTILLVKIDDQCVPISEKGVKEYRTITSPPTQRASLILPPKNTTDDDENEDVQSKDEKLV